MNTRSRALSFVGFLSASVVCGVPSSMAAEYEATVRVSTVLRSTTTASGAPIDYPDTTRPEVSIHVVEIPAGTNTGWHQHPVPVYAYMLEGSIEVELEDGRKLQYRAGEGIVEVVNLRHIGRNLGATTAKLVLVVTGEQGAPFTVRQPASAVPGVSPAR